MRLYVTCRHCGGRIYLQSPAKTKADLPVSFELTCLVCNSTYFYSSSDVTAESGRGITAGVAILGGIVGAIFGPGGALAGAILGAGAGGHMLFYVDVNQRKSVEQSLRSIGCTTFPFSFETHGAQTWKIQSFRLRSRA